MRVFERKRERLSECVFVCVCVCERERVCIKLYMYVYANYETTRNLYDKRKQTTPKTYVSLYR
jgi:hypothetical protein